MAAQDYLKMPYHIVINPVNDESGFCYYATVLEFDGCQSHGDTYEEAFANIQEAMEMWIEAKLDGGFAVPAPLASDKFSGKFVLRLPKSLHARLAFEAGQEGVSLNQYALYKLSR